MHDSKKQNCYYQIYACLKKFAEQHLDPEITRFTFNLLKRLNRESSLSLESGKPEIWAGAIVWLIARLNFLFDKNSPHPLDTDVITEFYQASKSGLGQKAGLIQQEYNITRQDPEFCYRELVDWVNHIFQSDNILLKNYYLQNRRFPKQVKELICKEDASEHLQQIQQAKIEQQQRREQAAQMKREAEAEKRREQVKDQYDLFS